MIKYDSIKVVKELGNGSFVLLPRFMLGRKVRVVEIKE